VEYRGAGETIRTSACASVLAIVLFLAVGFGVGQSRSLPAGATNVYPTELKAAWCAQVPTEGGCAATAANGTENWTVMLTMTWPANDTPTSFYVAANQSTGTPFIGTAANLSRDQRFAVNATDSVVMGTNLHLGWGLNPTQNWIFAVCAGPCLYLSSFVVSTNLSALVPNGTIAAPSTVSLAWQGGCGTNCPLVVGWSYAEANLTANFFRVGLLNGSLCLRGPTLAQWNATNWRHNTTANDSYPSPDRTYTFYGEPYSVLSDKDVCAYVEAVNRSIGDGVHTIYPHGLPAKEGLLPPAVGCPRCRPAGGGAGEALPPGLQWLVYAEFSLS